jgi:hypothetical protein
MLHALLSILFTGIVERLRLFIHHHSHRGDLGLGGIFVIGQNAAWTSCVLSPRLSIWSTSMLAGIYSSSVSVLWWISSCWSPDTLWVRIEVTEPSGDHWFSILEWILSKCTSTHVACVGVIIDYRQWNWCISCSFPVDCVVFWQMGYITFGHVSEKHPMTDCQTYCNVTYAYVWP